MDLRPRLLVVLFLLFCVARPGAAADARFDLIGPRIDVRVTRDGQTLPIAAVPNLKAGDRIWLHPDLPESQSVKYLLICVFLRGTTNPPPENWFTRIETWDRKVREEGAFVTVPAEAQQALLFMAPETGGDFSTLRSAVQGRPGAFVRASQDLTEAGFEEARIERYVASIRRVPPTDSAELQKHSDLLARTLDLKPNSACFKQSVDTQFSCLTQSGSQVVLDDGHGQSVVAALTNGPGSDFISQASYTQLAGAGLYSAYVGAIVDVIRIMANLHTAQYQYIPAISFPQAEAMNLRLNTPPSFHNPKSVLVIALPSVQPAVPPPLRAADPDYVACLIKPSVTLPVEGAPLVFSTDFAHDIVLHFNTPPGAPPEPDISLTPDPYYGGLVLQQTPQHHVPLHDPALLTANAPPPASPGAAAPATAPSAAKSATPPASSPRLQPIPATLTGTVQGRWGFDSFTGPTVPLQQLPGRDWTIVARRDAAVPSGSGNSNDPNELIAGRPGELFITSTGSACVHNITAQPPGQNNPVQLSFKPDPQPDQPNLVAVTLPVDRNVTPGELNLAIQQYDQPQADKLAARTFSEPAHITAVSFHAGDRTMLLQGTRLDEVEHLTLGDLTYTPVPDTANAFSSAVPPDTAGAESSLQLMLPPRVATPTTQLNQHLTATVALRDGRSFPVPVVVSAPRPVLFVLRKTVEPPPGSNIALSDPDDLPLSSRLTFTLKTPTPFPRNGEIEIETLDGTLRTVLTLAPSGGLVLQDPHTIVATLEPQRSFGPSAFGALRLRAIYPIASRARGRDDSARRDSEVASTGSATPDSGNAAAEATASSTAGEALTDSESTAPTSDWVPLVTLVRLPALTQLQCLGEATQPCTLTGSNLFLLQAISTTPDFSDPVPVPDGYTGESLAVPHPAAGTLFFKLRDDPGSVDSAVLPTSTPPTVATHRSTHHRPQTAASTTAPSPAAASSAEANPSAAPSTSALPSTSADPSTGTPAENSAPPAAVPPAGSSTAPAGSPTPPHMR